MSAERFEKIQEDGNKAEHHNILKTLAEAQTLKKCKKGMNLMQS